MHDTAYLYLVRLVELLTKLPGTGDEVHRVVPGDLGHVRQDVVRARVAPSTEGVNEPSAVTSCGQITTLEGPGGGVGLHPKLLDTLSLCLTDSCSDSVAALGHSGEDAERHLAAIRREACGDDGRHATPLQGVVQVQRTARVEVVVSRSALADTWHQEPLGTELREFPVHFDAAHDDHFLDLAQEQSGVIHPEPHRVGEAAVEHQRDRMVRRLLQGPPQQWSAMADPGRLS